ncbi:MAG: TIGR04283 family arsenosugar biosynthesis glycosyltransferase, partial [Desulfobulbaceae bacterium]|nr:TIGR04283 family arsenosugar biosynthesis glycosyltransferase [Desulfobulbaceae bacterium]
SSDNTVRVAQDLGMRVVSSPPGRGSQLNRGAEAARGDIFFFLHCDTIPPPTFPEHIRSILAQPGIAAGAFRFEVDAQGPLFRAIEWGVRLRNTLMGAVYGDQGIFTTREVFEKLGGFPEQPLLEDYEFMRRVRRHGTIGIAPAGVRISPRRWHAQGPLRTTMINQLLILGYHLGISPKKLAAFYYSRRY